MRTIGNYVSSSGVAGFLVVNCSFYNTSPPASGSPNNDNLVSVINSSAGVFENDAMAMGQGLEWVYTYDTTGVAFNGDTFTNAPVVQLNGTHDYFGANYATIPSQLGQDLLGLSGGGAGGAANPVVPANDVIDANHLDGSTDLNGYNTWIGSDDVIGVDQECRRWFVNDHLDNGYDCGPRDRRYLPGQPDRQQRSQQQLGGGDLFVQRHELGQRRRVRQHLVMQGGTLITLNGDLNSLAAGQSTNYMTGNTLLGNVLKKASFHRFWHGAVETSPSGPVNSKATVTPTNTFTSNNFGNGLMAPVVDAGIVGTQSGNLCPGASPNITCGTPVAGTAPGRRASTVSTRPRARSPAARR